MDLKQCEIKNSEKKPKFVYPGNYNLSDILNVTMFAQVHQIAPCVFGKWILSTY